MSLRKLTAGDGYTYLTRQVAAQDATSRGYSSLGDYYAEKGESPGVWLGRGLAGLTELPGLSLDLGEGTARVGSAVSEAQMKALFGQGRHPDAELIAQRARAVGHGDLVAETAGRLGSPFRVFDASTTYRARVAAALAEHNTSRGRPAGAPVTPPERARVRTEVARLMFAEAYDREPVDARELSGFLARASRQPTTAVAGYDMTFSPAKSVSALWALAPVEVARVIERTHRDAVTDTLAWLQDHAAYTRTGHGSRQQVEVRGLIAAAFVHRDARSGDPDLHTHVAVSNKVQTAGGRWLALDGRPLHKLTVAASERYNTRLEALLVDRLQVVFAERPATEVGKRPVREIVGISQQLLVRWSARRAVIDVRRRELATAFQREHGRPPSTIEAIALAQQATLETRERKHEPRSLREQRAAWRSEATEVLGTDGPDSGGLAAMLSAALHPVRRPAPAPVAEPVWVDRTVGRLLEVVQRDRAVWQDNHVRAEAERLARSEHVPLPALDDAVEQLVDRALGPERSIPLGAPSPVEGIEPVALRRRDGSSVYATVGSQLFTSAAILAAEQRLVDAARRRDGTRLPEKVVELALLESTANGVILNPGQAALVRQLATSGARLQLALAPAGTGKTTAMKVLARAWSQEHGRRSVLGLAPSAKAAVVLREQINPDQRRRGAHADTLAKLLSAIEFGARTGWWPDWVKTINAKTLVVVDEAAMAGTADLDAAVSFLIGRGASVRLVGDDQQLSSISAGGVLRDIAHETGALALSHVVRFARTPGGRAEAAASLALREGDPAALAFYLDHGRVHVGDVATATEQAFTDWRADREAGRDAIMLAPTREVVAGLNERARADRLATQAALAQQATRPGRLWRTPPRASALPRDVRLADGARASVGDTVITRHNARTLAIGRTEWVKNSDRFVITAVCRDGSLRVRHLPTRRRVTLPADYVGRWVTLGYATTVHTAQGVTAEVTRLVATGAEARQLLYVGMTRGQLANHLYLAVAGEGDPHEVIGRDALLPPTAADLLARVLARDDAPDSATTAQRAATDPSTQLAEAVARYHDALGMAAAARLGEQELARLDTAVEQVVPGVTGEPAYPALRQMLALIAVDGPDPIQALRRAAARRELTTADDKAAVLHWRLDATSGRAGRPLPWLPAVPAALASDRTWGAYLAGVTGWIAQLRGQIDDTARSWTSVTAPAWAVPLAGAHYPELIADLAVWRAAIGADSRDPGLLGPPQYMVAEQRYADQLGKRLNAVLGDPASITARWEPLARSVEPRVLTDPYWPQLAARLDTAGHAGLDIATLAARVGHERPLPDDMPAAAWWWRIAGHLSPGALSTDTATERADRLRPAWTPVLTTLLGAQQADTVMDDPAWTAVVAALDTAAATTGQSPAEILTAAICPARGEPFGTTGTLRPDELAIGLVWRITALANEPPDHPADGPWTADEFGLDEHLAAEQTPAPSIVDLRRMTTTVTGGENDDGWWDTVLHLGDDTVPDTMSDPATETHAGADRRQGAGQLRQDTDDAALPSSAEMVAALEAVFAFDRHAARTTREDHAWEAIAEEHKWATAAVPRARLVELNNHALDYYRRAYPTSWAPGYLADRLGADLTDTNPTGIKPTDTNPIDTDADDGPDRYRVGYAPPGWTHLVEHLRSRGATDDELLAAGLAARASNGRLYDRFRDRLILPIHDTHGDIVGFSARANPDLGATDARGREIPKYLNTPGTDLFTKGEHLYGLPEAGDLLADGAVPVRVEGPLDAIAVTLAGEGRYVGIAPLGTSLTDTQARLLARAGRTAGGVIVATDPDRAGHAAAEHDYWTLTSHGDTPRHAALPEGLDPAELLRTHGPAALRDRLAEATSLAQTLIGTRLSRGRTDGSDVLESRRATVRSAAAVIAALPPEQWPEHIDRIDDQVAGHGKSTYARVIQAAAAWITDPDRVALTQQEWQRRAQRAKPEAAPPETTVNPLASNAAARPRRLSRTPAAAVQPSPRR